jgi:hypothetical protein
MRIGLVQHAIVLPTTDDVCEQRNAILRRVDEIAAVAGRAGVNVLCTQEFFGIVVCLIITVY